MPTHIKIGDISPRIQFTGDGVQTVFAYPFPIFMDADMAVYADAVLQTIVTDYTVAGAGVSAGGSVTFGVAPALGVVVTLRRKIAIQRTTDFQESGEFRSKVINDELDYIIASLQQVFEDSYERGLHMTAWDTTVGELHLPVKADRLGKLLGFDATTGLPIVTTETVAQIEGAATSATAAAADAASTAADVASLTGVTSTTSLLISVASKAFTVATGVSLQAGDWVLVTSDGNPMNYMYGSIASYVATTLTVNVTDIGGSGTFADWTIRRSGTRGAMGATGATGPAGSGDVLGPISAVVSGVALFDGATGKLLKDGGVLGTASAVNTGTGTGLVPLVGTKSATLTLAGLVEQSTSAENITGTDDTVFPSVAGTKEMITTHATGGTTIGAKVATTTGTSVDITGIAADVLSFDIGIQGFSCVASHSILFQLGDGTGGIKTTGYNGAGAYIFSAVAGSFANSAGFRPGSSHAAAALSYGRATFTLIDAATFTWECQGWVSTSGNEHSVFSGTVSLTAALDRIRVTTVGAVTFDAGYIVPIYHT